MLPIIITNNTITSLLRHKNIIQLINARVIESYNTHTLQVAVFEI